MLHTTEIQHVFVHSGELTMEDLRSFISQCAAFDDNSTVNIEQMLVNDAYSVEYRIVVKLK